MVFACENRWCFRSYGLIHFLGPSDPNKVSRSLTPKRQKKFEISWFHWKQLMILDKMRSCILKLMVGFRSYVVIPPSGATLNNHTISMETHWLCITAMLQGVCITDWLMRASAPQLQNFWNVPMTFDLLFLPKIPFSNEKNFQVKLWSKVIFSQ